MISPQLSCIESHDFTSSGSFQLVAIAATDTLSLSSCTQCRALTEEERTHYNFTTKPQSVVLADSLLVSLVNKADAWYYTLQIEKQRLDSEQPPVLAYTEKGFEWLRPRHQSDVLGYFLYESVDIDSSYVLYVGQRGPYLVHKLFAAAGRMPADKVLQRALPQFVSTPSRWLEMNLDNLQFKSPFGSGFLQWQQDSTALVFHEFRGRKGKFRFRLWQ